MKICQYCGNRLSETDKECPVCHRPVQDFTIPKHPENRPLWKWLGLGTGALSLVFVFAAIRDMIAAGGLSTSVLSDVVLFLLMLGVSAIFAFFYHRSI